MRWNGLFPESSLVGNSWKSLILARQKNVHDCPQALYYYYFFLDLNPGAFTLRVEIIRAGVKTENSLGVLYVR